MLNLTQGPSKDSFRSRDIRSLARLGHLTPPLYDGGHCFLHIGELVPSSNGMVGNFTAAAIQAAKPGIGTDFCDLRHSIAIPRPEESKKTVPKFYASYTAVFYCLTCPYK